MFRRMSPPPASGDLFAGLSSPRIKQALAADAWLLPAFAASESDALLAAVSQIASVSPFRHMVTPGNFRMSVAMTNCGTAGWVTDLKGYRYQPLDPETGQSWPPLPAPFLDLAARAAAEAGFPGFVPDAGLINRYEPGTRLSLHQDRNERDARAPIVSVSLGVPATFLFGGSHRADKPKRFRLDHGDVAVWGGASRFAFHGVAPLAENEHAATGRVRFNLTFRKAL
jgi:alkylated DNA repair protein (DNA oxidative demethylase)